MGNEDDSVIQSHESDMKKKTKWFQLVLKCWDSGGKNDIGDRERKNRFVNLPIVSERRNLGPGQGVELRAS